MFLERMDLIVGQFDHRLVFLIQHIVTKADILSRYVPAFHRAEVGCQHSIVVEALFSFHCEGREIMPPL